MIGGSPPSGMKRMGGEGSSRDTETPGSSGASSGASAGLTALPPFKRIVLHPGFNGSLLVKARRRRGGI